MNKNEFVSALAAKADISKTKAAKCLDSLISIIKNELSNGGDIRIVGFGSFSVKETAPKDIRNPQTGQKMHVAASKRVKFAAGKDFKSAINHNSAKK